MNPRGRAAYPRLQEMCIRMSNAIPMARTALRASALVLLLLTVSACGKSTVVRTPGGATVAGQGAGTAGDRGPLAFTGSDVAGVLALVAAALVGTGLLVTRASRRRARREG